MSVRIRPSIVSSLDPQILATTLTASVLTSLQDYITVFNGSGHAIYYNKELTPLCHCRRPSSRNGFQPDINMDELNITTDLDCQELQNDIQKALREGVAFAGGLSKQAVLKCDAYPDGLMIYYELNKLSMDMEALTEYTEDKCAIVLVIRPLVPASPSVSVHDSLEGVLDNINGILLHTLSPASITTAIRSRSSSGYDFVPTSGGSSGAAMPVESLWTIAERVDLIRRSLDELIVTLHPRISTSRSSGYPNNHSSSSSGSGSSRRLGTNGNVGNAALLYTEPVLGEEGNDDMLSSRGTGAPSMSCTLDMSGVPELATMSVWEFDVFDIPDKRVLMGVMWRLIDALGVGSDLGVSESSLQGFVQDVAVGYRDNPFHNLHHATCVTHFTYMLINAWDAKKFLSSQQVLAVILSSVAHDVDHPGNANQFEINSQSDMSLMYKVQAVLESHHCATMFQILRRAKNNFLLTLPRETCQEVRKTMTECIMATDMAVHFGLVTQSKGLANGDDSFRHFKRPQEKLFLCKMLVHAADLSNPIRPFHMTQRWARLISEEFNRQVDKEKSLGYPVTAIFTADDEAMCKNEVGFTSYFVAPMWKHLIQIFPQSGHLTSQMDSNIEEWKTMQAGLVAAAAASVKAT